MLDELLREALEGAPLGRAGENRVFDYYRLVRAKLEEIESPLIALEMIRSIELVEKVNLPDYCYIDMNTGDYRAEATWHVAREITELLTALWKRFHDHPYAAVIANELRGAAFRRWPNFRAGGMEPLLEAERKTGLSLVSPLRDAESTDARWWSSFEGDY